MNLATLLLLTTMLSSRNQVGTRAALLVLSLYAVVVAVFSIPIQLKTEHTDINGNLHCFVG